MMCNFSTYPFGVCLSISITWVQPDRVDGQGQDGKDRLADYHACMLCFLDLYIYTAGGVGILLVLGQTKK